MKILRTKHDLKEAINKIRNLGFVPTMGSLHNGHIYLIKKSKLKCNKTLVSIYVNPKQFNNKKPHRIDILEDPDGIYTREALGYTR